ncbi:metalloprotease TldD [Suttonella sp. R2A3]|uniref:metalloprotease TldD n=1 Tax=Suttonella sp. R2A3 TaxID=2908648 RepID=UPI001F295F6B|nr:metalloprotease TldD [Suttonella sp. R2A3]UJF24990.1 metalloprotease TldD [Suttonella sp. R2A3]
MSELWIADTALSLDDISVGIAKLSFRGIDDADVFIQRARQETWALNEGKVKTADYSASAGLGVRALSGEQTGFAYADGLTPVLLDDAVAAARAIARHGQSVTHAVHAQAQTAAALYPALDPLAQWTAEQKVALLHRADEYARRRDSGVVDVSVSLSGSYEEMLVMGLDGRFATDLRPLVRFNVSVVIERNGRRESGFSGGGGRDGYACFFSDEQVLAYVDEALTQAQLNHQAVAAPAGQMPVVLGNGWPGILLHEAVGHGLEGDFNRKKTSVFSGKIGEQVCSPLCSVIDDGTLAGRRGSLSVDDEGTPSAHNVLIENGVLKGYMQDRLNARLMGTSLTGNGRRESYAHLPMPRMTNTYLAAGHHHREEMIESVTRGIYAETFGGGQVDITNGQFVFAATQAYLIENGKLTTPVKGVTLIGSGLQAMQAVSMVGDDLAFDSGIGVCGKQGQSVPVGVGQPSVKIDELTVGGTAL